jgi:hypothetical protein
MFPKKFFAVLYLFVSIFVFTSCRSAFESAMGRRAEKLLLEIPADGVQFPTSFSKENSIIYVINNPDDLSGHKTIIKGFKKSFTKFYDGSYEFIDQEDLKSISSKAGSKLGYVLGVYQTSQGTMATNTGMREGSQYKCTFYDLANKKRYTTKVTSDYGTINAAYLKKLGSLK